MFDALFSLLQGDLVTNPLSVLFQGERELAGPSGRIMRRLLDLAVEEKLCTKEQLIKIEESVKSGKSTEYYIDMYSKKLGETRAVVQHILGRAPAVEAPIGAPRTAVLVGSAIWKPFCGTAEVTSGWLCILQLTRAASKRKQ